MLTIRRMIPRRVELIILAIFIAPSLLAISISTTPGVTVVLGSGAKLTDTATLSGGFSPTGTITFTLTDPTSVVVHTETVTVSGNGTYSTPTGFVPNAAGTYEWIASYSGDANNVGVASTLGDEPELVSPAHPAITTMPGGTVVLGSGAKLADTATLSGGFNPSGTITFTLTGPTNVVVDTETVTVSGNGTYSTPTGFLPTAAGTYQWVASYSGDANNVGVATTLGDEPESVSLAHPAIRTMPGATVVLGSGAKLTDTATLSGGFNPTGTITFTLTGPTNFVVDTETVPVSGNGTYSTPTGFLPTAAGTYQWVAAYSGDANNVGVANTFGDEPESVSPAHPAIMTTPGGTVVLGSGAKLTDTATLSGGSNPTGTITFTLTGPTNAVVDTETVPVSGNGTYTTPAGFVPNAAGTYEWMASYSGDANNVPAGSTLGEPESVSPAHPAIGTTPGGTVVLGSGVKLTDTATLSGGFNPTGTITFTLTGPTNAVVDTETVTVSGNGTYSTPTGFVPIVPGTYEWMASYSGDGNNVAVVSTFGDEPESVSPAHPAITTTPGGTVVLGSGVKLTDTATLSGGFNPTGTITFTLSGPTNVVVDTETVTVSGNGTYSTPTGFVPIVPGTYEWKASYSGDANNVPVGSTLGDEPESVSPAHPAITTTPGGTVVLGSGAKLTDTATLSGGFNPTGTITFTLTNPTNAVVDTETVTVSGNGTYSTPTGFVPTTAGTYQWVATYSGDANNGAVVSTFGDEPESVQGGNPPTLAKVFGAANLQVGNSTTLTFTLTNPAGNPTPLTNLSFSDTLPAGLVIAAAPNLTSTCGGTATANGGGSTISLTGGSLVPNASCTVTVNVTAIAAGIQNNVTSALGDAEGVIGTPATAKINIVQPPTIAKSFAQSQLQVLGPGDTIALSFTITNPNSTPLTGIAFFDTLPAGLIVSTPNGLTGSCDAGTITAVAASNVLTLSGATLAGGASCTFSVNVTATQIGVFTNVTSPITAFGGTIVGNPATATVSVNFLFYYWFFAESGGGRP